MGVDDSKSDRRRSYYRKTRNGRDPKYGKDEMQVDYIDDVPPSPRKCKKSECRKRWESCNTTSPTISILDLFLNVNFRIYATSLLAITRSHSSLSLFPPAFTPRHPLVARVTRSRIRSNTMSPENVNVFHDGDRESNGGSSMPSHTINFAEPLPELHTPHKKRRLIIWIGVTLVIIDLCALPIAYYYAFKFGTKLSTQDSMHFHPDAVIYVLIQCSIRHHYWDIRLD